MHVSLVRRKSCSIFEVDISSLEWSPVRKQRCFIKASILESNNVRRWICLLYKSVSTEAIHKEWQGSQIPVLSSFDHRHKVAAGLRVFMADVFIDMLKTDMDRPVEIHRFLVHKSDGKHLSSRNEKK